MYARVSTFRGTADRLGQAPPADNAEELRRIPGFRRAYALADRESGDVMLVTFWESEAALRDSAERATRLRGQIAQLAGASDAPVVRVFEVVAEVVPATDGERR